MEVYGYAKINLFLDIECKRDDGYHNIISVMQTVDWYDKVKIVQLPDRTIQLSCTNPLVPTDERNTAYKAAKLFLESLDQDYGVNIFIEKNIPMAAGLAGGSCDAAAVLCGMNELFGFPFSEEKLLAMGKRIGADVPFCIKKGSCLTKGIGDILEPFPAVSNCWFVCTKSGEGVSTPAAYGALDKVYQNFDNYEPKYKKLELLKQGIEHNQLNWIAQGMYNVFEQVIEADHSSVSMLKTILYENGAKAAMMSGSGPSVFGIFTDLSQAQKACTLLQEHGATAHVCLPVF